MTARVEFTVMLAEFGAALRLSEVVALAAVAREFDWTDREWEALFDARTEAYLRIVRRYAR
jgi:hypothetical protein